MAVSTNLYAIQKVFNAKLFDLSTGECLGMLMKPKESILTADATTVYTTGGISNSKGSAFSHSKVANIAFKNAYIDFGTTGAILGSNVVVGANTNFVQTDVVTVTTNTGVTQFTALGVVGSEIKFAYVQNLDGTLGAKLTQNATASAGKFAYAFATKALTFFAGDVPTGSKVVVFYNTTTGASTRTLQDRTDSFSKEVKLVCDSLVTNTCDGIEYGAQLIFYKAKTSNTFELSLSADGEPAVMAVDFEALTSCASNALFDLIIYDTAMLT